MEAHTDSSTFTEPIPPPAFQVHGLDNVCRPSHLYEDSTLKKSSYQVFMTQDFDLVDFGPFSDGETPIINIEVNDQSDQAISSAYVKRVSIMSIDDLMFDAFSRLKNTALILAAQGPKAPNRKQESYLTRRIIEMYLKCHEGNDANKSWLLAALLYLETILAKESEVLLLMEIRRDRGVRLSKSRAALGSPFWRFAFEWGEYDMVSLGDTYNLYQITAIRLDCFETSGTGLALGLDRN
ncbi:hypothetical protein DL95DRAFT_472681 [Leptodontidium sp. 2 PMI_412]|nr:hypothetical protein DL95DRAFT_472681 [Leptodontidium sp. 2 PMI_412]